MNLKTPCFHTYMHRLDLSLHTRLITITGEPRTSTKGIVRDATNEAQSTIHHTHELQMSA